MNQREQQGLIKAFEYKYELAWNTLRDLLRSQGDSSLLGSRDTLREAFRLGLIEQGEAWMLMLQDRNLTSHTYNRSTADAIAVSPLPSITVSSGSTFKITRKQIVEAVRFVRDQVPAYRNRWFSVNDWVKISLEMHGYMRTAETALGSTMVTCALPVS